MTEQDDLLREADYGVFLYGPRLVWDDDQGQMKVDTEAHASASLLLVKDGKPISVLGISGNQRADQLKRTLRAHLAHTSIIVIQHLYRMHKVPKEELRQLALQEAEHARGIVDVSPMLREMGVMPVGDMLADALGED